MNVNLRALESGSPGGNGSTPGADHRSSKPLALLVIALLVLGSVVVYQQYELSALIRTVTSQSSELASPSSSLVVSNFTVTKLNATSKPVMTLVFWNNGTTPASSGDLQLGVTGQSKSFQSCYNSSQNFFPIFSNETTMIVSPLICGNIGDDVELTASVDFLGSEGTVLKVFNARATIQQANYSFPPFAVMNEIGIRTVIVPEIIGGRTFYTWIIEIRNESPSSVVSINASASFPYGQVTKMDGCFATQGFYRVGRGAPLLPGATCSNSNGISPINGKLAIGERFSVMLAVMYSNGTISSASVNATVEPAYVLYQ